MYTGLPGLKIKGQIWQLPVSIKAKFSELKKTKLRANF